MTTSPQRPIRKFNPGLLQSDSELIEQFVVRQGELDIVLETLRGNINSPSCQHALLVAPRGQGKTMLLARIAVELRTDENLSTHLFPVQFMEESLEVFTLADFWLETLFHLARETETSCPKLSRELCRTHDDLTGRYNETLLEDQAFAAVVDAADRMDKQLVLMVENLQALSRSVDEDFGWKLRKVLQCEPQVMLLGTATSRFAALDDATQPFFEFFHMVSLEPLGTMACRRLWEMVSGQSVAEEEVRPLEILTGGNPRLLVIVATFAGHRSFRQLLEDLVALVDEHTEYFRSHLDVLAKTERRVYLAVIDLWQPSTAGEVAARARMDIRTVSTMLGRLVRRGAISFEGSGSKRLYFASEQLYCIYYSLRRKRDQAGTVRLLLQFMTAFYAPREAAELLHEFWQEVEATPGFGPLLAEAIAKSSQSDEALDHHLRVANDLTANAQLRLLSGHPQEAIEIYNKVITRFRDSSRAGLQKIVVAAVVNVACCQVQLGESTEALATFDDMVARFGASVESYLQQMVAIALLNKGMTLRLQRSNPTEALAAFEAVLARFGTSDDEQLLKLVARAMVGRAATYGDLGQFTEAKSAFEDVLAASTTKDSHVSQEDVAYALLSKGIAYGQLGETASAIQCFEALVGRFVESDGEIFQELAAQAFFGKGVAYGQLGETAQALVSFEEIMTRFGTSDNPRLRVFVAKALVGKSTEQLKEGRPDDAMSTCNELAAKFGALVDSNDIPFAWHADWSRAKALAAQGRATGTMEALRSLVAGFDPGSRSMVRAMLTLVPDLISQGTTAGDVAEVLSSDPHKAAALQPLVVALRQHAGEVVRAPVEVMEVAADIRKIMEQRDAATKHVAQ